MSTITESALRKIRKALALARDNSNADESHSAMLLAQRLMAKHNFTASDIVENDVIKKTGKSYSKARRIAWWQLNLGNIVAENFRCYSFYAEGRYVGFVGLEEDVKIALEVFDFASNAIKHHSSQYLLQNKARRTRRHANALKNDYIFGFLNGLRDKFEEQVESESLALVLVKDELAVRAFEEMKTKPGKQRTINISGDDEAKQRGYVDGKNLEKPAGTLTDGTKF